MLITISGQPHSGKSTLIESVTQGRKSYGFLTAEQLDPHTGQRVGFQLVGSEGQTATLASTDSDSDIRVSKYGVELEGLHGFIDQLRAPLPGEINYIDEVGQMELHSPRFEELVSDWVERSELLIVTLSEVYKHPLIDRLREQGDININIAPETRGRAKREILEALSNRP